MQAIGEDGRNAFAAKAKEVTEVELKLDPGLVGFRTLTDLCTILNDNPGLIAKHFPDLAHRFEGVLSRSEWDREDRFRVSWVDFAHRSQIVAQMQNHLHGRSGPNILHLAGLSGVGKTRTVREACQAEDLGGVLYVPRYEVFTDRFLRHLTRHETLIARVVIDEVPLSEVASFTARVHDFAHRLRFITIGPARREERSRPSANILILPEPDTREGILAVVRQAGIGLNEAVLQSIADFSAHDLRLALMLVDATARDGEFRDLPIQDGTEVWKRVTRLFQDHFSDVDAFRQFYPYLTISVDIGYAGEYRHELEHVANQFDVPVPRLDEAIAAATPCGLGVKTPHFFEAAPRALAGHLFRHFVWSGLQPRVREFLSVSPDRLLRRFAERCQECVGPERQEMEEALQGFFNSALGDKEITRLAERERSRLFKAWAEFDPAHGLAWLHEAVGHASSEQLAALDGNTDGSGGWRGRRQVVWLCENLACFGQYFRDCEEILFRLAQVETEPSIGNNSTGVWRELFGPILAHTEVPFIDRAAILLERLQSTTAETLPLIMAAGVGALSPVGMRMAPPTVVGGRLVPEPWRPCTYQELRDLQRSFATDFLQGVRGFPPDLYQRAAAMLIDNLTPFLNLGLFEPLRMALETAANNDEVRLQLRLELEKRIRFRDEVQASGNRSAADQAYLDRMRQWSAELAPNDLLLRVKELTAKDYWSVVPLQGPAKQVHG